MNRSDVTLGCLTGEGLVVRDHVNYSQTAEDALGLSDTKLF